MSDTPPPTGLDLVALRCRAMKTAKRLRDNAIIAAARDGETVRSIAEAADLSPGTVQSIITRGPSAG